MSEVTAFTLAFAMVVAMKIVCFILGFLTIRLGYRLISSGIKGEFKFSAKFGGVKADLVSVSPGLLFVLLGVSLIACAIYVDKEVTLERKPRSQIEKPRPPIPELPSYGAMEEGEKSVGATNQVEDTVNTEN
jgi:hypothetical protein